jgi:hypothetical protein
LGYIVLQQQHHAFEQLVNVNGLPGRLTRRPEQAARQPDQPIGLANDDLGTFQQARVVEFTLEQLRRAAQTAERISHFMCKLTDHLPTGSQLTGQCLFPVQLVRLTGVEYFDYYRRLPGILQRRHPACSKQGLPIQRCELQLEVLAKALTGFERTVDQVLEFVQTRVD